MIIEVMGEVHASRYNRTRMHIGRFWFLGHPGVGKKSLGTYSLLTDTLTLANQSVHLSACSFIHAAIRPVGKTERWIEQLLAQYGKRKAPMPQITYILTTDTSLIACLLTCFYHVISHRFSTIERDKPQKKGPIQLHVQPAC